MATYTYERVTARSERSGICPVCGKRGKRSTTITNTVNPFNRNEDGTVRTRAEVRACVNALAVAWRAKPFVHAGCEQSPTNEGSQ